MGGTNSFVLVQVRPEAKDIFAYKMYHSFWSFLGVIRLFISTAFLITAILSIGKFETMLTVVLFAFGSLNPIISPIMYWIQASSEAKKCIPTTYTLTTEKIHISDGKKSADILWENLSLLVWLKKELFLYTSPNQALVLPKRHINEEADALLKIIQVSSPPNRTVIQKWL